jgi:hypothetical protein
MTTFDPLQDLANAKTVYMSLWGWLVRLCAESRGAGTHVHSPLARTMPYMGAHGTCPCRWPVAPCQQEMLELIEFIDEEFSRRDAVLCFIWSRLRTSMDLDPSR